MKDISEQATHLPVVAGYNLSTFFKQVQINNN